jgi:hypothetical protein
LLLLLLLLLRLLLLLLIAAAFGGLLDLCTLCCRDVPLALTLQHEPAAAGAAAASVQRQSKSTVQQAPQDISATLQHVFYVHSIRISMHKAANAGVNMHC